MSTAPLATVDLLADPGAVLADYLEHVAALGLSGRSVRGRARIATTFLTAHPDLREWMAWPAPDRLTELRSTGAWPLLCHVIGRDELRLDLEFAAVKNLTGLGRAVEARDPDGFTAARTAGLALGCMPSWVETVLGECLAVLLAWHGGLVSGITDDIIDEFDGALAATQSIPPSSRRAYRNRIAGLRQMLFQARIIDTPPRRRRWARSYTQRFAEAPIADPILATLLRYVTVRAAVLRPKSVESLITTCCRSRTTSPPPIPRSRPSRIWIAVTSRVSSSGTAPRLAWATRRCGCRTDHLEGRDPIDCAEPAQPARRPHRMGPGAGTTAPLRVGELLDLELGSVIDYGPAGTWLKVPLGKLATERMVPLSATTITALDEWTGGRGVCRPLPNPRTGASTDFLFVAHGRRLGQTRLRNGLVAAVESCGLRGKGGAPLVVTPHQLRHTWATELANAGMSLQALMALLGHVTPQIALRYAILASPTLRDAYDQAIGKMRRRFTLTPVGKPIVPDTVSWLGSEMLKTRVAHGYCSRHEAAGACPYANICETCDNFVTGARVPQHARVATHRYRGPRGRRPRPWLARRSRPSPSRRRRLDRPSASSRPLTQIGDEG